MLSNVIIKYFYLKNKICPVIERKSRNCVKILPINPKYWKNIEISLLSENTEKIVSCVTHHRQIL